MATQSLLLCRDPDVIGLLRPILDDLGMGTEVCTERAQAAAVLRTQRFNPVIVDCEAIEGAPELLRSVRQSSPNKDSIALSIIANDTGLGDAFQMGANLVLRKPVSEGEARQVLRTAWALVTRMRRRFLRHVVHTLHYVEMEGVADTPMLLDIGEGGFSVQALEPLEQHQSYAVRFPLPGEDEDFYAVASVAWTDSSGRVGMRFLGMPAAVRQRLKGWLATHAEMGPPEAPRLDLSPEAMPDAVHSFPLRLAPAAQRLLSLSLDVGIVLTAVAVFGLICLLITGVSPRLDITASAGLLLASLCWLLYRHVFFAGAPVTPGSELARLIADRLIWRQQGRAPQMITPR
jgi:CheY-like chemotaxis protein